MTLLNQIYANSSLEKYLFYHSKTKVVFIVHPCLRVLNCLNTLFLLDFLYLLRL